MGTLFSVHSPSTVDVDLPSREIFAAVVELVLQAGKLIELEWGRPGGPRGFGDKAEVDLEIEVLLQAGLIKILACDFVGEETGVQLSGHRYCWVVDPNDGTSDFLKGHQGSAISVGLLRDCIPVLGVVYAPVTARGPDCIAWAQGMPNLLRNGKSISFNLATLALEADATVFVSVAALSSTEQNARLCEPATFHPMPSIAYRLARVAAGDGVAAVSLYPISPHDVVAGHALLRAVGGDIWDKQGRPLSYSTPSAFTEPVVFCFGGAEAACRSLVQRPWNELVGNS